VATIEACPTGDDSTAPALTRPAVRSSPSHGWRPLLLAAGGYALLALLLWWHVWTSHPTSTTTCGCGDSSLFTWFLAWVAHAMANGTNPLFSTALFHPTGVNLLSNTGVVGIGIPLSPITWLFGPVATLNVALTLSPFLSALAMFVLLRRWVTWVPAAFMGGLLYGFSPFVLIGLTDGHLMLSMAVIPPLVVVCLDEILIRQRRRPVLSGATLGLLIALQFFIGTEGLVLTAIAAVLGVALIVAYGLGNFKELRSRVRHALVALGAAGTTALVLLAYPIWFTFSGPAALTGPIWGKGRYTSYGGTTLADYFWPTAPSTVATDLGHRYGGYQAPTYSGQYFGWGILAVLVLGVIIWRRDRRLWLFGALAVISVSLSFGLQFHHWTLWRLFVRFPLMDNVIPSRFLVITYLAVAVMLGLIIDHTVGRVNRWGLTGTSPEVRGDHATSMEAGWRWRRGALAGLVVGAVALVPIIVYYAPALPFTTRGVVVPRWYRTVAPHLPERQVLLSFPVAFAYTQSAMMWQAVEGMRYSMVGGGGPDSIPQRAGKERLGQTYIGNLSLSSSAGIITSGEIAAVRQALNGWGVTLVVVPDTSRLPIYEQVRDVRTIATVITAATGRAPAHQAGAWIWSGVSHAGPMVRSSPGALTACAAGRHQNTIAAVDLGARCVLASPADRQ
jgi:hypothetical protein